jgi:3-hydroxy-9,10-secoandrosta-1,3,5(10)-triene-9,17-dione monooxygenase
MTSAVQQLAPARPAEQPEVTEEALIARAEALVPTLKERAAQTEAARMLPAETMADLHAAGLLRFFQPKRFGGYELEWGVQVGLGRTLAKACASTSWIACVVASHSAYVARMSPEAQEDVWGSGEPVLVSTGSVARGVRIRRVEGGYRLDGRWSFCSGCDHAAWALTRGVVEGETDGAQSYFLYPRSDFRIEDDWYVSGMRGTGSKTIVVDDIFVPEHRVLRLSTLMSPEPPGARVNRSYVYSYNFRPLAGTALMGPILGSAEAILENYMAALLAGTDVAGGDVEDPIVELRTAESAAEIGAAQLLIQSLVDRQRHYGHNNLDVPQHERVALVRDRTFAARLCFSAAERIVSSLDARDVFAEGPIQRQFRDLCGMVQQIGVNWDRNMLSCARAMFGLKSDVPYFNTK